MIDNQLGINHIQKMYEYETRQADKVANVRHVSFDYFF